MSKLRAGEFRERYSHLTTPEREFNCGRHARIALVIDGSAESSKDQAVICALATLIDFSKIKAGNFFLQLRSTSLKAIGQLARMRPESVKSILMRLQAQYRIYLRRPPQRNYKSRTIIQVGIGPGMVLFAPRLTPESMFNETSRTLFDLTRREAGSEAIKRVMQRAAEHLARFTDVQERTRLEKELERARRKYIKDEAPPRSF